MIQPGIDFSELFRVGSPIWVVAYYMEPHSAEFLATAGLGMAKA